MRPSPVLFAAALAVLAPAPARAAESFDACAYTITSLPVVITTQGVWCLEHDVATAIDTGAAVTIAANNVTLDCNHFKIGGLAAGTGTQATGITADGRVNVTVRHCNVRGFRFGFFGEGLVDVLIEDNIFQYSTFAGLYLDDGDGTVIRRNRISDTGEGSIFGTEAMAINAEYEVDIVDNLIDGVRPDTGSFGNDSSYAIYTALGSGSIRGNRIRGVVADSGGIVGGIYNVNSERLSIVDNDVDLDALQFSVGVRCTNADSAAVRNVLLGTATGVQNCASSGNFVDTD